MRCAAAALAVGLSCLATPAAGDGASLRNQLAEHRLKIAKQLADQNNASLCPRGRYRGEGTATNAVKGGLADECIDCPRGRYGSSVGLDASTCTAECPAGRYNDQIGQRTVDDCKFCPPGTWGATAGLKEESCSGHCEPGRYISEYGATSVTDCQLCDEGYRGWQCTQWTPLVPKRGESVLLPVDEDAHAYIDGQPIPQGSSQVSWQDLTQPLNNIQQLSPGAGPAGNYRTYAGNEIEDSRR
jgi:hypothetical protein